jgi:hypothetical protein
MDYRDERDALRGRVENLEQELGDAKRELEAQRSDDKQARIAQIEKQMADARRMLDQLGRELTELRGGPPKGQTAAPTITAGVAVLLLGAGAAGFVLMRSSAPPPPQVTPVAKAVATVAPLPERTQPPQAPAPKPAPVRRATHATWSGKITKATGSAPPPGTACTVEATLAGANGSVDADEVVVTCGGKALYRSTDALEGMSMNGGEAKERAGKEAGTFVYALQYDDKGTRTGARNEVSLDTSAGVGSVWRTSVPMFHVDFSVAAQSAPVRGASLLE